MTQASNNSLKTLHIGNIANNGYNNAKVLNRHDHQAHVICYDYYHIMGCPEWEDAPFTGKISNDFYPDWREVSLNGFKRPQWFAQGPRDLGMRYLNVLNKAPQHTIDHVWRKLTEAQRRAQLAATAETTAATFWHKRHRIPAALKNRTSRFARKRIPAGLQPVTDFDRRAELLVQEFSRRFPDRNDQLTKIDIEPYRSIVQSWKSAFQNYDLIEGYSTDPILPMLTGTRPVVAYEHGTIRDIPFEDSPTARLTALAYSMADGVVITNPDCKDAADRLGCSNVVFIPHLIDQKYYDPNLPDKVELPQGLSSPYVFCPARQHWDVKGNEIALRAFAAVSQNHPELHLAISSWGPDVERTKELLGQLGVLHKTTFLPVLNIHELIAVARRSRVLIDQFKFAVFGGIGPTALACGTPLVTNLDYSLSAWCMQKPPYFHAQDIESCTQALSNALAVDRNAHSREQFEWMRKNYWYESVATRHLELYDEVLSLTREAK